MTMEGYLCRGNKVQKVYERPRISVLMELRTDGAGGEVI